MKTISTKAQKPNTTSTSPNRWNSPAWRGWRCASTSNKWVEKVCSRASTNRTRPMVCMVVVMTAPREEVWWCWALCKAIEHNAAIISFFAGRAARCYPEAAEEHGSGEEHVAPGLFAVNVDGTVGVKSRYT